MSTVLVAGKSENDQCQAVAKPRVVMRRSFGRIEIDEVNSLAASTVTRVDYDHGDNVKT